MIDKQVRLQVMVGGKDNIATGPGLVTVRPRKETKQSYFMLLLYAVNTYERGYRTVWARDGMSRWRELLPYALLVLYWQCLEFVRDPESTAPDVLWGISRQDILRTRGYNKSVRRPAREKIGHKLKSGSAMVWSSDAMSKRAAHGVKKNQKRKGLVGRCTYGKLI